MCYYIINVITIVIEYYSLKVQIIINCFKYICFMITVTTSNSTNNNTTTTTKNNNSSILIPLLLLLLLLL